LLIASASEVHTQQPAPATPAVPWARSPAGSSAGAGRTSRFASDQWMVDYLEASPFDPNTMGKNSDFGKDFAQEMTSVLKGSNLCAVTGLDGSFSKRTKVARRGIESAAEKAVIQRGQDTHADTRLDRVQDSVVDPSLAN
jgi:hypothetical protein